MSIRNLLVKIIGILLLVNTFVAAGPAISGVRTFTQPDGTKFEGVLKGDSSFHWIESEGSIVIVNPQDKFYHKAIINTENKISIMSEKPTIIQNNMSEASPRIPANHEVTNEKRKKLNQLYKNSKIGSHPQ
jgi:hypothetical protein